MAKLVNKLRKYYKMTTHFIILVNERPMKPIKGVPNDFKTYQEALDMVSDLYGLESLKKDVEIIEVNPYLKIK